MTVILTTYNGESRGYLKQAIESVLSQTYQHFQLIIVDDGSIDSTYSLCEKYFSSPKLRYIHQKNKGLPDARNIGINQANGNYICFLDDDDYYEPTMLEVLLSAFRQSQNSRLGIVYPAINYVDSQGDIIETKTHANSEEAYKELFNGNFIAPSSVMIKKEVFENVGLFKSEFQSCEDYELWFRITKSYAARNVNQPLLNYRVHTNKMSSNIEKMMFYRSYALYLALSKAPQDIKKHSNLYYQKLYLQYAGAYLASSKNKEFRTYFNIARAYSTVPAKWYLKYLLSYFPTLFKALKKIRQLTNSRDYRIARVTN